MGMTTKDPETQKKNQAARFFVELIEKDDPRYAGGDNYYWAVIDRKTGKIIGEDGGASEDQALVRDWAWVPAALNALNDELQQEIHELKQEICELEYELDEVAYGDDW